MASPATTRSPIQPSPLPVSIAIAHPQRDLAQQSGPNALVQLANSCIQRATIAASQSPPSMMTPRLSPQPVPRAEDSILAKSLKNAQNASVENAANAGREAALKISTPLLEVAKSIQRQENGANSGAQVSPTSISSFGSLEGKSAFTTTAPAVVPASISSPEAVSGIPGPESGRALIDPGITGGNDTTPNNRSFTFPPPLGDDAHSSGVRNHSLPNTMYSGGSPRTTSGKRHKCPYCATEFTRHHNLKSHLLTHSQEKPYECQQCNSRFRRLHDLKRHSKLHTGEKPHNCPNCGRKFARGDALARHSKGPGGCAGRRPSFIEEDPSGSRAGDDSMDGIEYTAEPGEMDDSDMRPEQRATDPMLRSSTRQDSYRPNTYPGIAPPNSHGLFPPSAPRSQEPSITSSGPSNSLRQFNAPAVFPQSSMTESPKPLSPGQTNDRSLSSARAMSSHFGSGRGGSPMTLPPPTVTGAPQLPGLQTFHPPVNPTGPGSHPGSLSSSHHSGSGGSTREILGIPSEFRGIIADLEARLNESRMERDSMIAQIRNEQARTEQDHRQQLSVLRDEVDRLKGQLAERGRT